MTFSWMTEFCLTVARINFKISGPPGAMGREELQQFSFGGKQVYFFYFFPLQRCGNVLFHREKLALCQQSLNMHFESVSDGCVTEMEGGGVGCS